MTATFTASEPDAGRAGTAAAADATGELCVCVFKFFSKADITLETIITKIAKKTRDKNTILNPSSDDKKLVPKLMYSVVIILIPYVNIWAAPKTLCR